ncbi:MAG: hypothetical protein M0036_25625 [Desulfobacteraceae bacterium]|nr:hypothetical protein [Desulfobacteraceae bacterium]
MERDQAINLSSRYIVYGYIAGFLSTLTFHQLALWLLWATGIAPFGPYNMAPTHPWGIPFVFSLALWGGVWGIILTLIQSRLSRGVSYWVTLFLFGGVVPSLVALLIVAPLKGRPVGGGWHALLLLTVFLINGTWGLGTGVFLRSLLRISFMHKGHPEECAPGVRC